MKIFNIVYSFFN